MRHLKFIVFIQGVTVFISSMACLVIYIESRQNALILIPITMGIVLFFTLLAMYVITPFSDWFFNS